MHVKKYLMHSILTALLNKMDRGLILPKPRIPEGKSLSPAELVAGRYGTYEQAQIWGPEQTFAYSLKAQAQASVTLSRLHPDIVPAAHANEICEKATLQHIRPERIRELEAKYGHDVIAISKALEEQVSLGAQAHIGKARTSADTTETARAMQVKDALAVFADSIENLRDITLEKARAWKRVPHMDCTHLYDALPSVAGRPFAHYAEMLHSDLGVLKFFYHYSPRGKWSDATGNHHQARALGIDGLSLESVYCNDLGLSCTIAPAQTPGLEFQADIFYVLARTATTLDNLARYVAWGRSDDVNIFVNEQPQKKKGSSAMPHKDMKNGNPTTEEQTVSIDNYAQGLMTTALANCEMPYARALYASANSRINYEAGFKFIDHGIRNLAHTIYWLGLHEERSKERVLRSYGVVTAQQVMTYLTDHRKTPRPMPRSEAHDLTARLAQEAYTQRIPFTDVLLKTPAITERLDSETIRSISNPLTYSGESERIIEDAYTSYYQKKTLI